MSQKQQRNISLYLKVPTRPISLLQRLENSLLESLIDHKPIDYTGLDLRRVRIFDVQSSYQVKGTAEIVDNELLVQFPAKHVGVHTARIFANTKEICKPVAFLVKASGDVESIEIAMATALDYTDSGLVSGSSTVRGVESQPTFNFPTSPSQQMLPPTAPAPSSPFQQTISPTSYKSPSSRPASGEFAFPSVDNAGYAGDLFGRPTGASFNQLLTAKMTKQVVPGIPHSSSHTSARAGEFMTPEALAHIDREARKSVGANFGVKVKKRCDICSRKTKSNKCVTFWEMDFCDRCCKRNFMLRSAIEHFMPPSIQECTVQVPLNKRGTKIANSKKIMPNVNLRGLEPVDVRNAMQEFHKFDVEGDGWMEKVVLLPVLKACFTYTLPDHEIRALLSSASLASMMETMSINTRTKVHHIEFLALLAFISRERQRLTRDLLSDSKFTHNDLQMAYAFQHQFGTQQKAKGSTHQQQLSQSMAIPSKPHPLVESYSGAGNIPKSYTDSPLSHYQPTSLASKPPPQSELHPPISHSPSAQLDSVPPTKDEREEEEEDDDEEVMPTSPTGDMLTSPTDKKPKKDMMEQLKLTGDHRADAWMLY